jgi:intracellular multiplication protein IcmL
VIRNAFYKDNFRRLFLIFIVSLILNIIMLFALLEGSFHQPRAIYFTAANDGKLVYAQPLNKPVLKNPEVLAWVNQTMPRLFSVDFLNYRRELLQTRQYFTQYGWTQFLKAIVPTLKIIKKQKYTVQAKPSDVPFIMTQGVVNGIYTWQIQVPLVLTYALGAQEKQKDITWTIIVQRMHKNKANQELGIAQIVQTK